MSCTLVKTFAGLPRTTRARPVAIKVDPKGKSILYCVGSYVMIRDLEDPSKCDIYSEHSKDTTVAAYSPSGFYIASADVSGKVRIWDTTQKEHLLKYEYQPISGAVTDIGWSMDNQKLIVGGDGKERFVVVFSWDTGTTVGEVVGNNKMVNSVDYRHARPFYVLAGGEDRLVTVSKGIPFTMEKMLKDHSNYVSCLRFSPDGSMFASAGADGKIILYSFLGELIHEVNGGAAKAHEGTVCSVSWSADNKQLLSCSPDKTTKIWNAVENTLLATFNFGKDLQNQQLGCLWTGKHIITVAFSGDIIFLDPENPTTPKKVFRGHNKAITSSCVYGDSLITASYDGLTNLWQLGSGFCNNVSGVNHNSHVSSVAVAGDYLVSCGHDDKVRFISPQEVKFLDKVLDMPSQPKAMAATPQGLVVVACVKHIVLIRDKEVVLTKGISYEPLSVAVHPDSHQIAVGGGQGVNKLFLYSLELHDLVQTSEYLLCGLVSTVSFSPDGTRVACGDGDRKVSIFNLSNPEKKFREWSSHTGRVSGLAWSPDSTMLASVGLDSHLFVWKIETEFVPYIQKKCAHSTSYITSVCWYGENHLITTGQHDCSVKVWKL